MKNFEYQLQLAGLSLEDYILESGVSIVGIKELLKSKGGERYLYKVLDGIKAHSLTIGDLVQVAVARGVFISICSGVLQLDTKEYSLDLSYPEMQRMLGDLLIGIDHE